MRIDTSQMRRFEWKYRVAPELSSELIQALRARTAPDPYCLPGTDGAYQVRSVYYDTPDLRFYHEKKDGVKIRRKLRVRSYGDDLYFLEIKRKIDKTVLKERVSIRRSEIAGALNGMDPAELMRGRSDEDLRTLERFRFNLRALELIPTVVIAYRRRALVGSTESHLRITLDSDLQSRMHPAEGALFGDVELHPFEERCVLEFKFDGRPPRWLMDLVAEFQLKREPYSKYCEGIDRWKEAPDSIVAAARSEVPQT